MIIGVLAVHDDADIIQSSFDYHLHNGVDAFCLALHRPTSEVLKIVDRYSRKLIAVDFIKSKGFDQDIWMQALRQRCKSSLSSEDWFIHFDADEFWTNLHLLKDVPSQVFGVTTNPWTNYIPHAVDRHVFDQIIQFSPDKFLNYSPLSKVAMRATAPLRTTMGNHSLLTDDLMEIDSDSGIVAPLNIDIDHFPLRTLKQFTKKLTQAEVGLQFTQPQAADCCWHWRLWQKFKHNPGSWFNRIISAEELGRRVNVKPITVAMQERLKKYAAVVREL